MTEKSALPSPFHNRPFLVGAARAADVTESRLRGADLAQPFRGVRVPTSIPPHTVPIVDRCNAYSPLLLPGQFFSHTTAALLWTLPVPMHLDTSYAASLQPTQTRTPDPLHVSSTSGDRPRRVGVVGHRALPHQLIVRRFGLPTSDAPATWLAMAPLVSLDDLIVLGDAIVRDPHRLDPGDPRPYATIAQLRDAIARSSGRGVQRAAAALAEVRVGSESPQETRLRLLLVRAGLPEPRANIDVTTRDGRRIGRGDLVWPEWRTVTEYDGEQHRIDSTQYARDERRIEEFVHAEWRVVRVRKSGLAPREQQDTIARVVKALRAGGWRG
jgi:hypothetical protein